MACQERGGTYADNPHNATRLAALLAEVRDDERARIEPELAALREVEWRARRAAVCKAPEPSQCPCHKELFGSLAALDALRKEHGR